MNTAKKIQAVLNKLDGMAMSQLCEEITRLHAENDRLRDELACAQTQAAWANDQLHTQEINPVANEYAAIA